MLSSMSSEDRKRSLANAADEGPRKRLHANEELARPNSTSTDADDEDSESLHPAYAGLEAFRKEAIYRKLLETRRDLHRTERRAKAVQDSLSISEQRAATFERFWTLFLAEVAARIAIGDQQAERLEISPSARLDVAALETELERHTSLLLKSYSSQGDVKQGTDVVELQQKYHELADEASKYKQELFLTQSKLQRSEDLLSQTTQKLTKVEHEYVRYQSQLLRAAEGKDVPVTEFAPVAGSGESSTVQKDSPRASEAPSADQSEALQKLSDDLESAHQDLDLTRRESDARYAEIKTLNEEAKALKIKVHDLQTQLRELPDELLVNSAAYRELQSTLQRAQFEARTANESVQALESENATFREERHSFQQTVESEAGARVEELEKAVKAKDADVTRLRGQRDDLHSECVERRQREQVKFTQIEEMKALLNSKEERLVVLSSQVRRLRMTVAALRGQEAGVKAMAENALEEDQFDQLSKAAKEARDQVAELEKRLAASGEQANGVKVEETDDSDSKAEIDRLKLALQAAEASCAAVDDELERISSAYADLEKQASIKVTDVSRMEEKALRLVTEKSKADNKYFSAMRVKDNLEAEVRAKNVVTERQSKVIERLGENEKSFAAQLSLHEKEVSIFRRTVDAHSKRISELQRDLELSEARLAESVRSKATASDSAKELINAATEEKDQRKRAEERIVRLEKDLETAKRQLAKAAASAAKSKGRRESETEEGSEKDYLNSLLQCSSCKERYRNRILTKCFHTFCNVCIDTRVQTRQRKCPHCGLAFAVSDVQPLYLQ